MFQFASSAPLFPLLLASFLIVRNGDQHSELLLVKALGAQFRIHSLGCTLHRFNSYKWLIATITV